MDDLGCHLCEKRFLTHKERREHNEKSHPRITESWYRLKGLGRRSIRRMRKQVQE